jgi:hypothetical protein
VKRLALATAGLLLAACSGDIQNTDAVKQSVMEYLRARTSQTGLNVDMMQVDVTSVSFQKDEAQATIYFRPKTGGGEGGMQMKYTLERKGGRWVVRGRTENGANPHGAGGMPPQLPLIQPPGATPPGQLPPGHPAVGSKQ